MCCFLPLEKDRDHYPDDKVVQRDEMLMAQGLMDDIVGYEDEETKQNREKQEEVQRRMEKAEEVEVKIPKNSSASGGGGAGGLTAGGEGEAAAAGTAGGKRPQSSVSATTSSSAGDSATGVAAKTKTLEKKKSTSGSPNSSMRGAGMKKKAKKKSTTKLDEEDKDFWLSKIEEKEMDRPSTPNRWYWAVRNDKGNYNSILQSRLLVVWRETKSPDVVFGLCKTASLLTPQEFYPLPILSPPHHARG